MNKLKNINVHCLIIQGLLPLILYCVASSPLGLWAQQDKPVYRYYYTEKERQNLAIDKNYKLLPSSVFLTVNGGVQGIAVTKAAPNHLCPSFGFKVGTMKNTGWFLGFMTNFNYRGVSNRFETYQGMESKSAQTYIEATLGLTGRYFKPVTFLFGVGYFYNTLNIRNLKGVWGHYDSGVNYGPTAVAGFMFHIYKAVLSVDMSVNYSIANLGLNPGFEPERIKLGVRAGVGFCLDRKKKNSILYTTHRDDLDGYGKDLRKQTPVSFSPSEKPNTPTN
jgi:long-subunit fatty acid transport protein